MKFNVKLEVSDELRRAWRHMLGQSGLATRRELAGHVRGEMRGVYDHIVADYQNDPSVRRRKARKMPRKLGADLGMKRMLGVES